MPRPSRDRLLDSAVDLLQRQGYHGTGLNELLERSEAPRGSLYHYFPGGKEQIGAEAIARAGGQVAAAVVHLLRAKPSRSRRSRGCWPPASRRRTSSAAARWRRPRSR